MTQSNTAVWQLRCAQNLPLPRAPASSTACPAADVPSQPGFLVPEVSVAVEGHRVGRRAGQAPLGLLEQEGCAQEKGTAPYTAPEASNTT